MKNLKRIISILLCLLMVTATVVSCARQGTDSTDTTAPEQSSEIQETETVDAAKEALERIGEADWGGKDFVILHSDVSKIEVQYVDISAALESCGKTLTRIEDMLVLADTVQDEDTMLILYRALY